MAMATASTPLEEHQENHTGAYLENHPYYCWDGAGPGAAAMPLAIVTTNLLRENVPRDFMSKMSEVLKTAFECNNPLCMVEVRPGAMMMRAGTTDAMVNVEIHHSYDKLDDSNKRQVGKTIADFLIQQLHVDLERILVLFFDTRCTTRQKTTMNETRISTSL